MIDTFLVSKVRVKIIKLFMLHTASSYHVRSIVREIDEEINAVRRILQELEEVKMLTSEKNGNRLYYTLNKDFIFFDELLSMINKEFGIGGKIIKHKAKIGNIKMAILSNSYIQDRKKSDTDIDLLIVGSQIDNVYLDKIIKDSELKLKREINYTYLSPLEFESIKRSREDFLMDIINNKKLMLIGDELDLYK
ncbi:MAG: winged helix-turn-helix domain-containing protein [Patescibacteria group bacterium]